MAIEYERVNWDTTKYVNPTNMNQMDAGIKAACDGVDENSSAITAINSTLTPSEYTLPTDKQSLISEISRGYYIIGNIVYVNLSFRASSILGQDQILFKLPLPKTAGSMMTIGQYTYKGTYTARVSADGYVRMNSGVDSVAQEFFMTGSYIKA